MSTQPQLFHIALVESDVVYTPDDVARDVVEFFKPTGKILEPCAGDGAFLKYLPPDTDWCEIEKGRDFFAYYEHVDWIVGNPPWSDIWHWLFAAFEIAENIVFIMPPMGLFASVGRLKRILEWGGIATIYIAGTGNSLKMLDGGVLISAVHFQRGYKGGTFTVFRENSNGRITSWDSR